MNSTASIGTRVTFAVAVVFCVILAGTYIASWSFSLSLPYATNYEGPMLQLGDLLAHGQNIYSPDRLLHEPWVVTIYPPLYAVIAAIFVFLFGPQLLALRFFSMLCCLLSAFLVYRIFCLSESKPSAALVATSFFMSFNAVFSWSYSARPDMLVTFLSLLAIERFLSALTGKSTLSSDIKSVGASLSFEKLFPVLMISWLAIMSKQQAAVFVLAIFAYLCTLKKTKLAFQFIGAWLALIAISIIFMQLFTHGFVEHLTFLSSVRKNSTVLLGNIASLGLDFAKVLSAFIILPIGIFLLKNSKPILKLPLILFLISISVSYFSMSIPASNINHLIPAIFSLSWLMALSLDRLPFWVSFLVVAASCPTLLQISEIARYGPQLLPFAQKSAAKLKAIDLKGKPVLTDDPYLNYLTDSQPAFEDCATFLNVWASREPRAESLDELLNSIKSKRYAAIIINSADASEKNGPNWWSPLIVRQIKQSYKKDGELYCSGWEMDLFLPRP